MAKLRGQRAFVLNARGSFFRAIQTRKGTAARLRPFRLVAHALHCGSLQEGRLEVDGLVGSVIPALEQSLRFRVARQGVLAANLANVDTPRYQRRDLSFEAELGRAAGSVGRTHPQHLGGPSEKGYRIHTAPRSDRPDGNGVELQREVVEASRNAGAFSDQAAVMSRLLVMRRIAVTGEAR